MSGMSHVNADGSPRMVDVSDKTPTARTAIVEGFVNLKAAHVAALDSLPKGDAITVAQIAGIQGGKRCSELIPLCHPIPLTHLDVRITKEPTRLRIEAEARTTDRTGVEMEAYTAVVVTAITLVDMLKGVDPDLEITEVKLLEKVGGKAHWKRG
jgi:cyclic pyranopterin monophosphate synthase